MITAQAKFAFDLLQETQKDDNSTIISPTSISVALGMTLLGAKNNTAKEIANAIGKCLNDVEIHKHFSNILQILQEDSYKNVLKMANKVYFANDFNLLESFKKQIQEKYNGNFETVDFHHPHVVNVINEFVANATNNEI
uniref:Serpin domain-containing protein n=1 Tax=Panagrolaimus sp. ES5 TaxID=591445 RepID=A0AC34FG97_9BILA